MIVIKFNKVKNIKIIIQDPLLLKDFILKFTRINIFTAIVNYRIK